MRACLLLLLAFAAAGAARAQPYQSYQIRSGTPGANDLPVRDALELAYQGRLSQYQLNWTFERARAAGDTTLIPLLWRVARAYRYISVTDMVLAALRQLGETDEAFLAEAERFAPDVPPLRVRAPQQTTVEGARQRERDNGLFRYVQELVNTAAARPDSSYLPRVVAVDSLLGVGSMYRLMLSNVELYRGWSPERRLDALIGNTLRGFVMPPSHPPYPSHYYTGPIYNGAALDPWVVWCRERLVEWYAADPATVEAAMERWIAPAATEKVPAETLRAFLREAATQPVAVAR